MLKSVKAVIFDMDGTIIDSMWVWKQVDIDYLQSRGIDVPEDLQRAIGGLSFTETAQYFKDRFNLDDDIDTIKSEWTNMVRDLYNSVIEAKKGVKEFLEHLKSEDYKIGMATSNYSELVEAVLRKNNLLEYFDTIVTTCEVPRDKSYPDVFLETARRLDILPEECLVFEDTLSAVAGAKSAGMKVIGVYDELGTCSPEELADAADFLVEHFENILEKLK